jgi:putative nucleotidyltransferase with HDIG domain
MMGDTVEKVRNAIERIPPLSIVVGKVIQVANNPRASAQELVDVIQLDPILTSKILKMVNSAYFGGGGESWTLKQSIVILGVNTIKNVAFSSAILDKVSFKKDAPLNAEEFWKHSLGVGIASKMIASLSDEHKDKAEDFFVAGLIHNIGKILLCNIFPDECRKITEMAAENKFSIPAIEKKILGLSHEEIGVAMGKKWKFEPNFLYAIGRHHEPVTEGIHSKYSMIVGAANYMVNLTGVSLLNHGFVNPLPENIWDLIGVEYSQVAESMFTVSSQIEKARLLLG